MESADMGHRIRHWREKAGLTPAQLAGQVGVDSSSVYHWEAGRWTPNLTNIERICRACEVGLEQFFAWKRRKRRS